MNTDILFSTIRLPDLELLIENSVRKVLHEDQCKAKSENKDDKYLTIQQAADLLHIKVVTLYSKHSKREIPGVSKVGKRLFFDRGTLLDYIKEGRQKTKEENQTKTLNMMAEVNYKRTNK
jgi:hypothetical protein